MVILSQGRLPEILYIDGFAGPGEYEGGEAGSPIIALDTALISGPHSQRKFIFFLSKSVVIAPITYASKWHCELYRQISA